MKQISYIFLFVLAITIAYNPVSPARVDRLYSRVGTITGSVTGTYDSNGSDARSIETKFKKLLSIIFEKRDGQTFLYDRLDKKIKATDDDGLALSAGTYIPVNFIAIGEI